MRLLIVGTLEGHIAEAAKIALAHGAKVMQADTVEAALHDLRSGTGAELVMIDVALPVAQLVDSLREERISVPVVSCGIGDDADAAVAAIKAGAKEYVPLPPDPELIGAVLAAVSEERTAIVHQDPAMQNVLRLAEQIAPSDASVLITGESGTGKELIARHIHAKSARAKAKFVSVNCAAIPDNLLESELFGHEKGAFTGAVARRIGKFEEANGGTLLLDEISEMDPRLQAKLLRALQEREIDRVGGTAPVKLDIRVLATSNRDLEAAVRAGSFREDLYYRLNVVSLRLPALRERPHDIALLAEHFVALYAESNGLPKRPLATAALDKIRAHDWPGNVRELENAMHRAVLLAQGPELGAEAIQLAGAPAAIHAAAPRAAGERAGAAEPTAQGGAGNGNAAVSELVGQTVAEVERELILNTLRHCLGNRTHAANILGISIRTLRNKLRQYSDDGIAVPMPGEPQRASL